MKPSGWMRLWVVLSGWWLLVAGFLAYDSLSSLYTRKTYEIAKDGLGKVEFVFSAAQPDSEAKEQIGSELIPLVEKAPQDYVNKIITTPYDEYLEKHESAEIWKCVKLALFPVFGFLAFGWSVAWVWRGFMGNHNA